MGTTTQALEVSKPQALLSQEAQQDVDGLRAVQYAARLMAKSGCFSDIRGQDEETAIAKAVVKIAIGRDYGFSAAESMQHIELIQGRPSIAAHARAAKMKAAGYSWKFVKFDATACHLVVFSPSGEEIGDSTFTIEDAKRMGLAGKENWVKNPRNMLYCRAIANAQRWYAPEVLSAALAGKEEVLDGEYGATPTFASPAPKPEPMRAAINIDAIRPSADENRGHDGANPDAGAGIPGAQEASSGESVGDQVQSDLDALRRRQSAGARGGNPAAAPVSAPSAATSGNNDLF